MLANNETGVIQPIKEIGRYVKKKMYYFIQMPHKQLEKLK